MDVKRIVCGNSAIDIIELFYLIKEMPRKKKKFTQKEFKKYAPEGYERLCEQNKRLK